MDGDGKFGLLLRFGRKLSAVTPGWVAGYVLLNLLTQIAIPLIIPVAGQTIADGVLKHEGMSAYIWWVALTVALIPLMLLFRVAQTTMDGKMENNVRGMLLDRVLHQSPEFFRKHDPGKLNNILNYTAVEAQRAIRTLTIDPVLQVIGAALGVWVLVERLNNVPGVPVWEVWAITAAIALLAMITGWLTQVRSQKIIMGAQQGVQSQMFELAGLSDAVVKAPEEIQAMDAEPIFYKKYVEQLERSLKLKRNQAATMELVNSAINLPTFISTAVLVLAVVISAGSAVDTRALPGLVLLIMGLTPQILQPFKTISTLGITASSSWPAVQVVTEILDEECRIKDAAGARQVEKIEPTLAVRNLDFTYAGTPRKVFNQLSFTAPPEKISALVARSGQGKTTFFRILLRFYDQDAGTIELGGMPLDSFTIADVRKHVVLMSQFPAFFHDTVRENFRFAKPEVTDEEIRSKAEETGLWPILERAFGKAPLDAAFAGGAALSGGEKKLFALTRCLLRDPAFLLLDEPTTGMDNQEIAGLIPLMKQACKGKTVIVVEHTMPFVVQFCDHVIVLDNGRIMEEGSPQELLARPGLFRELYELGIGQQQAPPAMPEHAPTPPPGARAARAMPA
jgi:ATP-binding cassette subfamily B protein